MLRQELDLLDELDQLPADSSVGFGGDVLPWGDSFIYEAPFDFSALSPGLARGVSSSHLGQEVPL